MAATQVKLLIDTAPNGRFNPGAGAYQYVQSRRQENASAATGKLFDYKIKVGAYASDGTTLDTSVTANATATVTAGTCTLGGTVTRAAVAGVWDFSDLYPATGTGSLQITIASAGLTSYVTRTMTVVAPQYDAYALARHSVSVEKPRVRITDTTMPTVFARTIRVGAGRTPVTGSAYQTIQAALDYCVNVSNDITGNTQILIDAGTYVETITLGARASGKGWIVLSPANGITTAEFTRTTPTDVQAGGVKISKENVEGLVQCAAGTHHIRFAGLEFQVTVASPTTTIVHAGLSIVNSAYQTYASALTDSLDDAPSYIYIDRCWIHAGSTITTIHMTELEGRYIALIECYVDDAHGVGTYNPATGLGSGDEQCVSMVSSPGPTLIRNNRLRGSGENILLGGASATFQDLSNYDVEICYNHIEAPLAWQSTCTHKSNTEVKYAQRLWLYGNVHEGAWEAGQAGEGIKFNGIVNGPYMAYGGCLDIIFERSFCRSMTSWLNISSDAMDTADPITPGARISVHDIAVVDVDGPNTRINPPGNHIDRVAILHRTAASTLTNCVVGNVTVLKASNSVASPAGVLLDFPNSGLPMAGTYMDDAIVTAEGYGILTGNGNSTAGAPSVANGLPSDTFANVLIGYDTADLTVPPNSFVATSASAVGFTSLAQIGSFATLDPDTVCAALTLTAGSTYSATGAHPDAASGDKGANMTTLRSAISGVWTGSSTQTATQLLLSTQPAGAVSGNTLTTQPAGRVADNTSATVTSDTSTVTASWVSVYGDATPGGTLTAVCVAGLWAFVNLKLTWTVPSQGHWHFADGSLTGVDGPTQFLPTAGLPSLAPITR